MRDVNVLSLSGESKEVKVRKYPIKLQVRVGVSLEDIIKAVKGLLTYYQSFTSLEYDGVNCPLCNLFYSCEECLWHIFHHMECDDFACKRFGKDTAELKRDVRWRDFRIKELVYWLEELERPGVKVVKLS